MGPDQLASQKPADLDLHCINKFSMVRVMICISTGYKCTCKFLVHGILCHQCLDTRGY